MSEHENIDGESEPSGERDGDDWDDWDDDDDWGARTPGGGTDTRLIAVVIVAAVAIIAAILFTRRDTTESSTPPADDVDQEIVDEGGEEPNRDWPWSIGGQGGNIDADGFYIWSDLEGIHLRSNSESAITVIFTADDPVSVKNPSEGATASASEGETITFEFDAGSDGSVGPDLDVSGFVSEFSVEVRTDDGPLPTERFFVGDSAQADANPAVFARGA